MESIYRIDIDGGPRHAVRRDGVWHALDGDVFGSHTVGAAFSEPSPRVLAPLVPSKIVAVGLNYKDHAQAVAGRAAHLLETLDRRRRAGR